MAQPYPSRAFRRQRERSPGALFLFGAADCSLDVPTGQTVALTRASGRTVLDSSGRVATLAHSQPPWSAVYNGSSGLWEPTLDFQTGATNLLLRSEDFGTTWSAVGTPTRTAGALSCGDLTLDLIGDDSAAAIEGYTQAITFTGNAVKAFSLFIAQGSSSSSVLRLRDTTASANRLAVVITWSGGVPSVSASIGTYIGQVACANGVYRLLFQTTSVSAANANQIEIYPATDAGQSVTNTGTLYAGGAQAENAPNPHAYIKTTSAAVATQPDAASATVYVPLTSDFTVYLRVARPTWAGLTTGWTSSILLCGQPTTASNGRWYLEYDAANQRVNAALSQAGSGQVSWQTVPAGGTFDVCAQFTLLATGGKSRVDVGSGFSAYATPIAAISTWDSNTLRIGGESGSAIDAGVRRLVIAQGAMTLAQMRGPQP